MRKIGSKMIYENTKVLYFIFQYIDVITELKKNFALSRQPLYSSQEGKSISFPGQNNYLLIMPLILI
jgi:hypothetical protein